MSKHFILCLLAAVVLTAASCSRETVLDQMEHIKTIGNERPQEALLMLDSLEVDIRSSSEYAKAKYDLLRIRLNDKADNLHTSDIIIKKLVTYFEKEGSSADKQEAHYYAGSVYRDLQDTPRALEYFFKSLENGNCDSIMLRNTYSNLNYLYYRVQNYKDATDMAYRELDICQRIGTDVIRPYMHLGAAHYAAKNYQKAEVAYDSAFACIVRSQDFAQYQPHLIHLLCGYSELDAIQKASKCLPLIESDPLVDFSPFPCLAFAQYYESSGKPDSAIIYCQRILDDETETDAYDIHDTARLLYRVYHAMGDVQQTAKYAEMFIQMNDSVDYGMRQELAATVNNQYKYHLDQKKEQGLKDEKERYKTILIVVSFATLLLASLGYILYIRRRNKHYRKIAALSAELQRVSDSEKQLHEYIRQKEQELERSKEELQRINAELSEYDEALREKDQQNKAVVRLLYQSEADGQAEDVIQAVRQSSTGQKTMSAADWKQLYQAVDALYPTFKGRLLKELGTFTEQQMQVCYLLRIGLSNIQIRNLTTLSRATVWRWVKKYDWVLTFDDEQR